MRRLLVLVVATRWHCNPFATVDQDDGSDRARSARDTLVIGNQHDSGALMSILAETSTDHAVLQALLIPPITEQFDCVLKPLPGFAKAGIGAARVPGSTGGAPSSNS